MPKQMCKNRLCVYNASFSTLGHLQLRNFPDLAFQTLGDAGMLGLHIP